MPARTAQISRKTKETDISLTLNLDGEGTSSVKTGIAFFDHMLTSLALHARFDVEITCAGDLEVDDHHSIEDCAIVLGGAIDQALGERSGIARFGFAYAPLDEALARCVVDFSGRAAAVINLDLRWRRVGDVSCENLTHFLQTLAVSMRAAVHVDVLRGDNDHHRAEAAFKAVALALRQAVRMDGGAIPSTKGIL